MKCLFIINLIQFETKKSCYVAKTMLLLYYANALSTITLNKNQYIFGQFSQAVEYFFFYLPWNPFLTDKTSQASVCSFFFQEVSPCTRPGRPLEVAG